MDQIRIQAAISPFFGGYSEPIWKAYVDQGVKTLHNMTLALMIAYPPGNPKNLSLTWALLLLEWAHAFYIAAFMPYDGIDTALALTSKVAIIAGLVERPREMLVWLTLGLFGVAHTYKLI